MNGAKFSTISPKISDFQKYFQSCRIKPVGIKNYQTLNVSENNFINKNMRIVFHKKYFNCVSVVYGFGFSGHFFLKRFPGNHLPVLSYRQIFRTKGNPLHRTSSPRGGSSQVEPGKDGLTFSNGAYLDRVQLNILRKKTSSNQPSFLT